MGRGKVKVARINNKINRQVTFSKRRQGLMKKANELSVLCGVDVGLIIFSATKKLYTFPNSSNPSSNSGLDEIVQKYLDKAGIQLPVHNNQEEMYQEVEALKEAISVSEQNVRSYLAEDVLPPLRLEDLDKHEQILESSLNVIRARKNQLMEQQLDNLRRKEQMLQANNGGMYRWLMEAGKEQLELPFFGDGQPSSSTVLQLATSSSSPHFFPYSFPSTHPNLQGYE